MIREKITVPEHMERQRLISFLLERCKWDNVSPEAVGLDESKRFRIITAETWGSWNAVALYDRQEGFFYYAEGPKSRVTPDIMINRILKAERAGN